MIEREAILILLDEILPTINNNPIWALSRFERIKHVGPNGVGKAGQVFIEALLKKLGIPYSVPPPPGPFDIDIVGMDTELKTASLDVNGSFQFNHIRPFRTYKEVLFLGIAPTEIFVGMHDKQYVLTHLRPVNMEQGADNDLKVTMKPALLLPVERLPELLQTRLKVYPYAWVNRRICFVVISPFPGATREWIDSLIPL